MQLHRYIKFFVISAIGVSATSCEDKKQEYDIQDVARVVNNSDTMITLHYREACDEDCTTEFSIKEITPGESAVVSFSVSKNYTYSGSRGTFYRPVKIDISAKSGDIVVCEASPFPDSNYPDLETMVDAAYTLIAGGEDCPQNTVNVALEE
jgi:hypothetical protein